MIFFVVHNNLKYLSVYLATDPVDVTFFNYLPDYNLLNVIKFSFSWFIYCEVALILAFVHLNSVKIFLKFLSEIFLMDIHFFPTKLLLITALSSRFSKILFLNTYSALFNQSYTIITKKDFKSRCDTCAPPKIMKDEQNKIIIDTN
ncbi:UNVERIFIED_CONTAM: hypothetical protein NCL1_05167 [Trichonephila clavipes]